MKKRILGVLIAAIVAVGVSAGSAWAATLKEAEAACSGKWSYSVVQADSNGSDGYKWTCTGQSDRNAISGYQGRCSTAGGSWRADPISGSGGNYFNWTCSGYTTDFNGSGGGGAETPTGGTDPGASDGGNNDNSSSGSTEDETYQPGGGRKDNSKCGDGVETAIIGGGGCQDNEGGNGIFEILNIALNILTFGVGVLATVGFVISGLQYLTARDDASQLARAKSRMVQIIIGLFLYAGMWTLLEFLLPGGVFSDWSTSSGTSDAGNSLIIAKE